MSGINHNDRLSSLPEVLLVSILSLLPIESAAATSVLSHRWRHLWTLITHLSLEWAYNKSVSCRKSDESVVLTVDRIISQLKSPKIHTFHLSLYFQASPDCMVRWIHQICLRDPEVIKISSNKVHSGIWIPIPNSLFTTQSLVQLQLDACFGHDNSGILSFNLRNLKKLALEFFDSNMDLISPLLRACPLLEDLDLRLCVIGNDRIVDMSTPNLKSLRLYVLNVCKLVIDAPKLEKFCFQGPLTFYEFVKKPSNLQDAKISIRVIEFRGGNDNNDYMSKIPGLIQGISCVRSLFLQDSGIDLLDSISRLVAPPMFHNLIHLSLSWDRYNSCINKLPTCLLLVNLKRLDIWDVYPEDFEVKLVEQILHNATVLEKLRLSVFFCDDDAFKVDKYREYEFCKQIFTLSKSSVNCRIEFSGTAFTASSEDFRDDTDVYINSDDTDYSDEGSRDDTDVKIDSDFDTDSSDDSE